MENETRKNNTPAKETKNKILRSWLIVCILRIPQIYPGKSVSTWLKDERGKINETFAKVLSFCSKDGKNMIHLSSSLKVSRNYHLICQALVLFIIILKPQSNGSNISLQDLQEAFTSLHEKKASKNAWSDRKSHSIKKCSCHKNVFEEVLQQKRVYLT